MKVSVVIPAHNPRGDYLALVLDALRRQSLPAADWELVVVDNRSTEPLAARLDLGWHPNARVVREEMLGLTRARLAGFAASKGEIIVLVDDDNVLGGDYLSRVLEVAQECPFLGVWGGSIAPRYEDPGLAPPNSLLPLLTVRVTAEDLWSNDPSHHASTPWGAGFCLRRSVALRYARELEEQPQRAALDLQGKRLLYSGDTDIAYTACRMGLGKAVMARLTLEHLIPKQRCSAEYLCRVAEGRGYTEVLHDYVLHGQMPDGRRSVASSIRAAVRRLRHTRLENKVMTAHDAGRTAAMRDLVRTKA